MMTTPCLTLIVSPETHLTHVLIYLQPQNEFENHFFLFFSTQSPHRWFCWVICTGISNSDFYINKHVCPSLNFPPVIFCCKENIINTAELFIIRALQLNEQQQQTPLSLTIYSVAPCPISLLYTARCLCFLRACWVKAQFADPGVFAWLLKVIFGAVNLKSVERASLGTAITQMMPCSTSRFRDHYFFIRVFSQPQTFPTS